MTLSLKAHKALTLSHKAITEDYSLPLIDPRSHVIDKDKPWTVWKGLFESELKIYNLCVNEILSPNHDTTLDYLRYTLISDYRIRENFVLFFINWLGCVNLKGIQWRLPPIIQRFAYLC